jgi:outer membrane protein OmpA-like peptidoglycan-associated protein
MRLSAFLPALGVLGFSAAPALAQDASMSVSDRGATSTFSGGYEFGDDPFEIGVFVGGIWLKDRELREPLDTTRLEPPEYNDVGGEVGLRLGAYPIPYLGLEVEGAAFGSRAGATEGDSNAFVGVGRGHLVGQLPIDSFALFVLGGAGMIGGDCPPEGCESRIRGRETELGIHFGLGAKLALARHFHIRLDARDTIASDDHLPEVLLTAAFNFGSSEPEISELPPVQPDSDGDGLVDEQDKCPREPASTPDGCPIPIGDRDGDGKKDDVDKCPDEPSELPDGCPDLDPDKDGIKGTADKCPDVAGIEPDGCPDPDPDKDGIEGDKDKCPKTPETVNGFEDSDGCPDTMPEKIKKFSGVVDGIQFDTGKATIRPSSYPILDEALGILKEYPNVELRITGHTDSQGSAERNRELSRARALAVADYFISRGIDRERLTTEGYGPDKPIAENTTKDGRQRNRRIEFEIVQ